MRGTYCGSICFYCTYLIPACLSLLHFCMTLAWPTLQKEPSVIPRERFIVRIEAYNRSFHSLRSFLLYVNYTDRQTHWDNSQQPQAIDNPPILLYKFYNLEVLSHPDIQILNHHHPKWKKKNPDLKKKKVGEMISEYYVGMTSLMGISEGLPLHAPPSYIFWQVYVLHICHSNHSCIIFCSLQRMT